MVCPQSIQLTKVFQGWAKKEVKFCQKVITAALLAAIDWAPHPTKKKKQNENFFEIKPNDTRKTMQNINAVLGDDCDENFDIDDDEPPSVVTINKTQTKDSYPIMNNVSL